MFGEVEGSLSAGLRRLYSTDLPSRISSNSLKTNDGRHATRHEIERTISRF